MARHEHVNQIPGEAGPLPAADLRCDELHQAQPDWLGPALVISPRGAGCSQGEVDGAWERVPGTWGDWHSAPGTGRDCSQLWDAAGPAHPTGDTHGT